LVVKSPLTFHPCRPDTPTSAKLQLHNIFRITSLPDGSLQFPNITSEALAEALNTNNASSLLVPKQVPRPDLTAAQLSPDYLISPILSPYTPNSATSVNGTTDAGSKKRKREQDESSPDEKSPEAKRVKLSDQKERKNNFTFATIIATCRYVIISYSSNKRHLHNFLQSEVVQTASSRRS